MNEIIIIICTYSVLFTNIDGCDSIAYLDLNKL